MESLRMITSAMIVMVAAPMLVNGDLNAEELSLWNDACNEPVCAVVQKEAEGLKRLWILSNYIKETISLMESVVNSLKDEIVDVSRELRSRTVQCHSYQNSTLAALLDIYEHEAKKNIDDTTRRSQEPWTSSDMTQKSSSVVSHEVNPVFNNSQTPFTTTTQQRTSQTTDSIRHTIPYHQNTSHATIPSSATSNIPTRKTVSQKPAVSDKYEVQTSTTSSSYVPPTQPRNENNSEGRWSGTTGQGHNRGHQGKPRSRGKKKNQGHGHGQGRLRQRDGCKGVSVESPYYVPNLDEWCKLNCPLGMCPSTHCIC